MKTSLKALWAAASFAAVLGMASLSFAEDLDRIVRELQQKYESISSVGADFTQEVASKGTGSSQTSEGKVYFKKPGKMRWIYQKPAKDELVSNGKTVWVYQPDLNQVMERPAEGAGSSIATDFLSGVGNLKKDFDVSLSDDKGGVFRLSLAPKEQLPNVKKLFIEIDKTTFLVVKTAVIDLFGNETRVSLKNIKTNTPQKDSFFEFAVPKGATVVRP